MYISIIKSFFMILCSYYLFVKLLHLFPTRKQHFITLLSSFTYAIIIYCVNQHFDYFNIIIMVLWLFCLVFFQYKTSFKVVLATSTISVTMAYIFFAIAALPSSFLAFFLVNYFHLKDSSSEALSFTFLGFFQLSFATIPFRFRRLKKGMPYLQEGQLGDTGTVICILLLTLTSLFSANPTDDARFVAYIISIVICGVTLVAWWLRRLTQRYLERLKAKEVSDLKLQIQQISDANSKLRKNNETLSKIIHKDNKLIPAMELSIRESLQSLHFSDIDSQAKVNALLQYLESVSKDRSGILQNYEHQHRSLPQTGILSIDSMIGYMEQKAYSEGINLNLTISGSVKYLTEIIIGEDDLSTLIADLLENALNAVRGSDIRYILLCIGIEDGYYSLDVFDSGPPFSEEVLPHLGKQRFTSHSETGGSGIGMMTTFEILEKCAASFVLDEIIVGAQYSKKISICFDGLNQFRVKSERPELLDLQSVRPDVILI